MIDFKKIGRMTPDQINQKFTLFVDYLKLDMPTLKKMGICVVAAVALGMAGKIANSHLQTSVTAAIEKRDEYRNIQNFLETYQRDAKAYKDEINKVRGKILDEGSIDKSNVFVQKLAESNNVTIVTSQRTERTKKIGNGVSAQQIKLSVEGQYSSILKMISEMENASFFIGIEAVDMHEVRGDAKGQKGADMLVDARIEYLVFFEKPEPEPKKDNTTKT